MDNKKIIKGYIPGIMAKLDKHYGEEWKSERKIVMAYIEKIMDRVMNDAKDDLIREIVSSVPCNTGISAQTATSRIEDWKQKWLDKINPKEL